MLKIFNTLTRRKEKFNPINSGKVGIYVCGVTAYDFCHLGHARTFIFFDLVVRYLRYSGYSVNYVRNITDIDDKIIQRSIQNHEPYQKLTNRMIVAMKNDFNILNILPPDHEPRVTEYISNIIEMIANLIEKNYAYIAQNGDIFFSVLSKKKYNILSGQNLKKLYVMNTSNINVKRHPMDFVLWKKNKAYSSTEETTTWDSPWGLGRPGWHIECSAISYALLGKHFDIHGGGSDLIFPHHENEIAQSTSAHDSLYVNFWMHVGMVTCNFVKISKSLNNFFTIRNILKIYDPETIRYFLMSTHYRNPISYTDDNLKKARLSLEHLYISLKDTDKTIKPSGGEYFISKFISKIDNDFNTPGAYSVFFELAHIINLLKRKKTNDVSKLQGMAATLRYLGKILGLLNQDPELFLKRLCLTDNMKGKISVIQKIEFLIKERNIARSKKEWVLADKIRYNLFELGVVLEDSSYGTTWKFII